MCSKMQLVTLLSPLDDNKVLCHSVLTGSMTIKARSSQNAVDFFVKEPQLRTSPGCFSRMRPRCLTFSSFVLETKNPGVGDLDPDIRELNHHRSIWKIRSGSPLALFSNSQISMLIFEAEIGYRILKSAPAKITGLGRRHQGGPSFTPTPHLVSVQERTPEGEGSREHVWRFPKVWRVQSSFWVCCLDFAYSTTLTP